MSQLKLNTTKHQMFTKQYKTKNFDSKAEQWRTEQEISGKFIKCTHKFKRRPRKLKKFIVFFEFCAQYSSRFELAGSKNAGKKRPTGLSLRLKILNLNIQGIAGFF